MYVCVHCYMNTKKNTNYVVSINVVEGAGILICMEGKNKKMKKSLAAE